MTRTDIGIFVLSKDGLYCQQANRTDLTFQMLHRFANAELWLDVLTQANTILFRYFLARQHRESESRCCSEYALRRNKTRKNKLRWRGRKPLCEDSRGRWYLCISVEYEIKAPEVFPSVGIDLGLKSTATLSNGQKVSNSRYYRMMERKLAKAQQGRKKRQAKGIHARIKNKRMDDLHKSSTRIVQENNDV